MEKGCGCDMRGMLSFYILWLLSKRPMHGGELAKEIGKRKGDAPKAGTIYPALKHLKAEGLIEEEKGVEEKTIKYHLTKEGKKVFEDAMEHFHKAFGEILEDYKWVSSGHPADI